MRGLLKWITQNSKKISELFKSVKTEKLLCKIKGLPDMLDGFNMISEVENDRR